MSTTLPMGTPKSPAMIPHLASRKKNTGARISLEIFDPAGRPFLSPVELARRARQAEAQAREAEARAAQADARAKQLAERLRALGIDPDAAH